MIANNKGLTVFNSHSAYTKTCSAEDKGDKRNRAWKCFSKQRALSQVSAILKALLLVVLSLCLLCSCDRQDIRFLDYQSYPLDITGILFLDGKEYKAKLTSSSKENFSVTFITPSELEGLTFKLENKKVTISDGIIEQEISDEGYCLSYGILLARKLFCLDPKEMSGAGVTTENGIKYSFSSYKTDLGQVTVYTQTGASSPEKIKATLNGCDISFIFMNK